MGPSTLFTFVAYFVILLGIGIYFYRRSVDITDYLLGGRSMGSWVTALSAQASDMSGWLLMGLPGAIYLGGMPNAWIAIGLFIGTLLNWQFVAPRLRVYTQQTDSITLPCFFEARFCDPTGLLRGASALIVLVFFAIYASSGLVATGLLFESTFSVDYEVAVGIGGAVIIVYTFLGGFLAVCWTDLLQGSLMVIAILVVPLLSIGDDGGVSQVADALAAADVPTGLIPRSPNAALLIASAMAWGLGYFGQPHILARFMSVQSLPKLRRSKTIAISWVFLSLSGAVVIGLVGVAVHPGLSGGDEEKIFIYMIAEQLNPWLGGVMLAAVFSAIMSTIDSQLLVSSSALSEDFYAKSLRKDASAREIVIVSRLCVIVISAVALALALGRENTILDIVGYAWGGLGAAFGPVVLFALFSRKTTWYSALAGMLAGTLVLVIWKQFGLSEDLYEIVPGFAVNCVTVFCVNFISPQADASVTAGFDDVTRAFAERP